MLDREFADFFTQHKSGFMRIAAVRLRNMHDADEALMDAAIQMHRKWPRIKAHANPMALAFKILNSAVTDFYRRRARRTGREVPVPGPAYTAYADAPTVDDILALRGYDGLDRALASLGERAPTQAECVRLRYLADMDFDEIGKYLNITKGAAKTNIHLGLKKLQAFMDVTDLGKGDS
ncbi:sigma-70 family RNA polymerase sigma factor [Streptomyces corynorhini]|uniref:Sigma-70 family RNA polymerase sigma factor n=1 Tax=Streptomyces corynorhini TaxID=2282652 RepID=A0A370B7P4_9ACTN|nr:sigma-70 family RNA polymerase sigma factor [Streptomyces corynorhini]